MAICPSCKSHDIERVRSKGFMKLVTSIFPIVKWRCRVCHHEFIRLADNIFSVRRVLVWLLLITVGFFIWLMQLDVTKFRPQTDTTNNSQEVALANNAQDSNTAGENASSGQLENADNTKTQGVQQAIDAIDNAASKPKNTDTLDATSNEENGGFDATVNSYLSESQMPSDKPSLSLSFIGVNPKEPPAMISSVPQPMKGDSDSQSIEETLAESDEIARLTRRINALDVENKELKERASTLTSDIDSSDNAAAIAQYSEEITSSKAQIDSLEAEVASFKTQTTSLEAEIASLKTEITDREAQVTSQSSLIDKANEELSNVNELLTSTKLELSSADEELATKGAELKIANEQLTTLNASLGDAKGAIDTYTAQIADLNSAISVVRTQYEAAEATIAEQSATIESLRSEYSELQNSKDVLESRIGALESENVNLAVAQQVARQDTVSSQPLIGGDDDLALQGDSSAIDTNVIEPADVPEISANTEVPEVATGVEEATVEETSVEEVVVVDEPQAPPQDLAQNQIKQAIDAWRSSWQNKDFDGYFAAYSSNFDAGDGPAVNLKQWRSKRRYIIKRAQNLEVTISEFVSAQVNNDRYIVRFIQKYSSATYSDEVIKQLVVVYEDGQWKIAKEESL